MAPILYMVPASCPVRAVLLCAKAIGVELDIKLLDLLNGEHYKEEFLKLNPISTVPTLTEEDGFTLFNSHAIMAYLTDKYGKDDSLYPKDLRKRAKVNEKLFFEEGVVFSRGLAISRPIVFEGKSSIDESDKKSLETAYEKVEKILQNSKYAAGDDLTIADFSFVTSLTTLSVLVPIDESKFPKVSDYIKRMEALPYFKEVNQEGHDQYVALIKSSLQ